MPCVHSQCWRWRVDARRRDRMHLGIARPHLDGVQFGGVAPALRGDVQAADVLLRGAQRAQYGGGGGTAEHPDAVFAHVAREARVVGDRFAGLPQRDRLVEADPVADVLEVRGGARAAGELEQAGNALLAGDPPHAGKDHRGDSTRERCLAGA